MNSASFQYAPLLFVIGFAAAWIADACGLLPVRKKHAGFKLTGYDKYCTEAMNLCREHGLSSEDAIRLTNKHRRGSIENLRAELLTEGPVMRSGFSSGPNTPKPAMTPRGQNGGYQPIRRDGAIISPPRTP
jgi:hypothetical protein